MGHPWQCVPLEKKNEVVVGKQQQKGKTVKLS